ncbi:protein SUPPRESSOR OF MAX2 1 [Cornus florida]|uniref:protein SUPPRESSOR OF MAX2 1 n=1 Tax=Cornus florida TaxID=4283 RepID=UPI0028964305|nr:protein SUPPRESSOR OF MAX2 1 [Cornus florida]
MRAGLSTIQQTLTPEATSVLNHSIAEAGRRNHGQTTPLHVAATLLASPSGFLRQACIRSHSNSSHPLQCRALELCFSVALERLPTTQNATSSAMEPPISNALMAALKRAQAHQRRGCPEQQQQPLLAVKVELEQLIISILDDPSVSRVMREASFSSPAVKATIEQSLNSQAAAVNHSSSTIGIGFRPTPTPMPIPIPIPHPHRNFYMNPRLQQEGGNYAAAQLGRQQRNDEVKRIVDILLRTERRNPVLVGELEPETVLKDLLRRIDKGEEFGDGPLKNVQVIPVGKELALNKTQIPMKLKELGGLIQNSNAGAIILDLGDLKWLVEQPVSFGVPGSGPQQVVSESERMAVTEMRKLLANFREGSSRLLWLIGTATCETYLRCQVYHPSMEKDWDLQAVPIASRSPLQGMFPRVATNGILSSLAEPQSLLKSFPTALTRRASENLDPARRMSCCPQCNENYEQELAKLVAMECEKSSSEVKSEAARPLLPLWLQNARVHNNDVKTMNIPWQARDREVIFKQKSQELVKKWNDTCLRCHPNFHHNLSSETSAPTALSMAGLYNPNLLVRQPFQPMLQQTRKNGESLQLNANPVASQPLQRSGSPPRSPVRTDLVLGQTKITETHPDNTQKEHVKDFLGCISSESQVKFHELQREKFANTLDVDSFKKLLKNLKEKVWWQQEAASAVATAVSRCKLGNGKRRGAESKGDTWLLFAGPDRMGKKKMASVLAEQLCGTNPIMICLGSRRDDEETDLNIRGKTTLDRIVEAVRQNPFSVIMLEDIDEMDMVVRGSIKRAMDRGRLVDSHGREMSLRNVIFILTANSFPDDFKNSLNAHLVDEKRLASIASGCWQLRLSIGEKSVKRRANWLHEDEDRPTKPRKEMSSNIAFDLNEVADSTDQDNRTTDGSHSSSDLTIDHEEDDHHGLDNIASVPHDLVNYLDDAIIFKPVEIGPIRREIRSAITKKFSSVVIDEKLSIQVEDEALEKILGVVWLGRTELEEWADKVLVPSFHQLKARLPSESDQTMLLIRLELERDSDSCRSGDPSKITVMNG